MLDAKREGFQRIDTVTSAGVESLDVVKGVLGVYQLTRTSDGTGAQGHLSVVILIGPSGEKCYADARPQIGALLFVGELVSSGGIVRCRGRMTSVVTAIVSDTPMRVVLETQSGSQYVWQFARDGYVN
jgi:hypothetical protein